MSHSAVRKDCILSFVSVPEKPEPEGRFQPAAAMRWEGRLKFGDSFFHYFGVGASEPLDHRQVEVKPVQSDSFFSAVVNIEDVGLLQ